jgi:hypothetical protein
MDKLCIHMQRLLNFSNTYIYWSIDPKITDISVQRPANEFEAKKGPVDSKAWEIMIYTLGSQDISKINERLFHYSSNFCIKKSVQHVCENNLLCI